MTAVTHHYRFTQPGSDFGPRKGSGLVILHTFESADPNKNTVTDALAGARWQDGRPGSYNRLIAVDGVVSCVPDTNISGGVNPASPYFKPLAWLYQKLPATKVNDPNSYALQLCAMGRRAYYDQYGWPPNIIDGFARSIVEETVRIGAPVIVTNHADFQPGNRTDAGAVAIDLVMKRIEELTMEDWYPKIKPIAPRRALIRKEAAHRTRPDTSPESRPLWLQTDNWRTIVATVEGQDFGSGPTWLVYVSSGSTVGLKTIHAQDEIKTINLVPDPGPVVTRAAYEALKNQAAGHLEEHALSLQSSASVIKAKTP